MIEIQVEKSHTLGRHKAKQAMKKVLTESGLDKKATEKWDGFKCDLAGEGLEGKVLVDDDKVVFALKISILIRTLGITSKDVEQSIRQGLDAALS